MSVLVMGMHRSGTSAATGVLRFAGLQVSDDRYLPPPNPHNPEGTFENLPLRDVNRRILEALHGEWSAPPPLPAGWENRPELGDLRDEAARVFHETMPPERWVWKDPRNCLTLPFWRSALEGPMVILFVHRDPSAVARSLRSRNGFPPPLGLAIWERYVQDALANMAGMHVVTAQYSDLLQDPLPWVRRVRDDLAKAGVAVGEVDADGVADFIRTDPPSKNDEERTIGESISPDQERLVEVIRSLEPRYPSFPALDLPALTPWTRALLEERREAIEEARRHLAERRDGRERHLELVERHDELKARHEDLVRELQAMPSWWRKGGRAYARLRASIARRGRGAADDPGA